MLTFRSRTFRLVAMLAVAGSALIYSGRGQAYTPEQQQACSGDAMRLCSADVPDIDRITACMVRNKAQLSPPCRVFFRDDPDPPPAAGKPLSIRPDQPGSSVGAKSRKSKKTAKPDAT